MARPLGAFWEITDRDIGVSKRDPLMFSQFAEGEKSADAFFSSVCHAHVLSAVACLFGHVVWT